MKMTGQGMLLLCVIKRFETEIDFVLTWKGNSRTSRVCPFDDETVERLHKQALVNDRALEYFAGRGITNLKNTN